MASLIVSLIVAVALAQAGQPDVAPVSQPGQRPTSSGTPSRLPVGVVVPDVETMADSAQRYALYLPTAYTPERQWPLLFVFDPGARGSSAVERFRVAAERNGYIVVGSNNSRNGLPEVATVLASLVNDVHRRFAVDPRRVYTAGMSGGARVAFRLAMAWDGVAGVIAASAGYPEGTPRKTLPFAVFATAGTEDFNCLEMRLLDRELTTPHILRIFDGGHVWPSPALVDEALDWMDLQALRSGALPQDAGRIAGLFHARRAAVDALEPVSLERLRALQSLIADFEGLTDVSREAAEAEALERRSDIRRAERSDRNEVNQERSLVLEVATEQGNLADPDTRAVALARLRNLWREWSGKANAPADSAERRLARRLIRYLSASTVTDDPDYRALIRQYSPGRRAPGL